jgi:DNA-directed RNA polymerase subunit beta
MHLVDDKIHSRSTGPYSLISTQPLRGRGKNGGQRFGEMEVWSLEGFGAAYTLQELFSIKSDDLTNRTNIMFNVLKSEIIHRNEISESLKILIIELQCLGIDIKINYNSKKQFF